MIRGQLKYVPKEMIDELRRIKMEFGVKRDADCFRLLAKSSKMGRELNFYLRRK